MTWGYMRAQYPLLMDQPTNPGTAGGWVVCLVVIFFPHAARLHHEESQHHTCSNTLRHRHRAASRQLAHLLFVFFLGSSGSRTGNLQCSCR